MRVTEFPITVQRNMPQNGNKPVENDIHLCTTIGYTLDCIACVNVPQAATKQAKQAIRTFKLMQKFPRKNQLVFSDNKASLGGMVKLQEEGKRQGKARNPLAFSILCHPAAASL